MLDSLIDLISDAWWTYPFLFAFALLDSIIPLIPSETAMIAAGVAAASTNLNILAVIAVGAAGAICGDNIAYEIGKRAKPWVERRFDGPKATARLAWAKRLLAKRGVGLIIVARFVPGGRTAVTVTAGMTSMNRPKFVAATVIAGIIWGTYAALLGYFGGKTFEDNHTLAFVVAFAIALSVTGLTEIIRWRLRRRAERAEPAGTRDQ
jgi:membrane protein DedA with SNARE-associated domain